MKLLCLGSEFHDINKVSCYTDVFQHYLPPELRRRAELTFVSQPQHPSLEFFQNLDTRDIDHILAFGLRYWTTVPPKFTAALRNKFKGAICQLYDGARPESPCDITFSVRNVDAARTSYIGWAADPIICHPKQSAEELAILVDHMTYENSPSDRTGVIMDSIRRFAASDLWKDKFKKVILAQCTDGGIKYLDTRYATPLTYSLKTVPFPEIASQYGKFHLFLVTHKESLGLCALETAMSGSLVVSPNDYIPRDRLNTIRHLEYSYELPWDKILPAIDIEASRKQALENNWTSLGERLLNRLETWKK